MVNVKVLSTPYNPTGIYDRLLGLYSRAWQAMQIDREICFTFDMCNFINQTGVTFLGALVRLLQTQGCTVRFDLESLKPKVRANLEKNALLFTLGLGTHCDNGNAIPYREDRLGSLNSPNLLFNYLREEWLGRGWMNVSTGLQDAIAASVWEIYANACEHSKSSVGVISCGQYYPREKQIALSVVDLGVGIPDSVRTVDEATHLADSDAIQWAMTRGKTSKAGNRGLGLDMLREFLRINGGTLEILSHHGHIRVGKQGNQEALAHTLKFPGTAFDIKLQADENHYILKSELGSKIKFS